MKTELKKTMKAEITIDAEELYKIITEYVEKKTGKKPYYVQEVINHPADHDVPSLKCVVAILDFDGKPETPSPVFREFDKQ